MSCLRILPFGLFCLFWYDEMYHKVLKYYLTSFENFLDLGIFQKVFSSHESLYVKCVKITLEVHSENLRGDSV